MSRHFSTYLALTAALLLLATSASAQLVRRGTSTELEFKFIGNASYSITDGDVTLVSDFPYRSGAGNYMKYDMKDFDFKGEVVCLLTHAHLDHWDALIYREKLWTIIGPPMMLEIYQNFAAHPVYSGMEYEGIQIEPEATRHSKVEHYSYLVTWHGVRIYFPGDAERARHILAAKNLDVAFVTPWLLASIHEQGRRIDAKRVVVYHHRNGENIVPYEGAIVPKQNDTFVVPFNDTSSE